MSKRKKRTKYGVDAVKQKLRGIEQIVLDGTILAIDPSCISASSKPGYALFKAGKMVESGVIDGIRSTEPLEKRLQFIGKYCREQFDEPDVLVIEHIVPGGKFGSTIHSTIRATGAIIGNFECDHVISISPLAWQKYIEKNLLGKGSDFEKYKVYKLHHKSDEKDAEMLGLATLLMAKENLSP